MFGSADPRAGLFSLQDLQGRGRRLSVFRPVSTRWNPRQTAADGEVQGLAPWTAAKSGGDFWVGDGDSGSGNNAASRRASSQPSANGQPRLAAVARFKYSCTVLTEIEQLRAICRWSNFSSFSRKTSLILRMDFLLAGNGFSLLEGSLTRR